MIFDFVLSQNSITSFSMLRGRMWRGFWYALQISLKSLLLLFGLAGMIVLGELKLEIRMLNLSIWKRHSQHRTGLFVFTRSSHQIIGGEKSCWQERYMVKGTVRALSLGIIELVKEKIHVLVRHWVSNWRLLNFH